MKFERSNYGTTVVLSVEEAFKIKAMDILDVYDRFRFLNNCWSKVGKEKLGMSSHKKMAYGIFDFYSEMHNFTEIDRIDRFIVGKSVDQGSGFYWMIEGKDRCSIVEEISDRLSAKYCESILDLLPLWKEWVKCFLGDSFTEISHEEEFEYRKRFPCVVLAAKIQSREKEYIDPSTDCWRTYLSDTVMFDYFDSDGMRKESVFKGFIYANLGKSVDPYAYGSPSGFKNNQAYVYTG